MDKKLSGLDPKLKEIYDRVMNTSVSQAQLTEAAKPTPTSVQQVTQKAPTEQVAVTPANVPQGGHDSAFVNGFVGTTGVPMKSEGSNISIWKLSVFAVVFLLIYTFIWIKVFRLQIPLSIPFINP